MIFGYIGNNHILHSRIIRYLYYFIFCYLFNIRRLSIFLWKCMRIFIRSIIGMYTIIPSPWIAFLCEKIFLQSRSMANSKHNISIFGFINFKSKPLQLLWSILNRRLKQYKFIGIASNYIISILTCFNYCFIHYLNLRMFKSRTKNQRLFWYHAILCWYCFYNFLNIFHFLVQTCI